MWNDSEEYSIGTEITRRVFNTPRDLWHDPEGPDENLVSISQGTSDLEWCSRVIEGEYFAKAGWPQYQAMRYPFLIDTNIFCRHINTDGEQFP